MSYSKCLQSDRGGKMSVQAEATIAENKSEKLVDEFGVCIGNSEWDEVIAWSKNVKEFMASYVEKKVKLYEEDEGELEVCYKFAISVENVMRYYAITHNGIPYFNEYWIVNPRPAVYLIANRDRKIIRNCASYTELLIFLVLGIARNIWSASDALYSVADKCTTTWFLSNK